MVTGHNQVTIMLHFNTVPQYNVYVVLHEHFYSVLYQYVKNCAHPEVLHFRGILKIVRDLPFMSDIPALFLTLSGILTTIQIKYCNSQTSVRRYVPGLTSH